MPTRKRGRPRKNTSSSDNTNSDLPLEILLKKAFESGVNSVIKRRTKKMRLVIDERGTERTILGNSPETFNVSPTVNRSSEWREQLEELQRRQGFRKEIETSTNDVSIETNTDKYQLLVCSGDIHMGCEYFDWATFLRDSNLILENPNSHLLSLGDLVDNFTWAPGVYEQVMNPQEQVNIINSWAKEMLDNNKMLATISGNHDSEWLIKNAGIEFFTLAFGYNNIVPHLREGGNVHWKVGNVVYNIFGSHRTKYNSTINPQHSNHRQFEMHAPNSDIVLSGHTHELGVEEWAFKRDGKSRNVYFAKTGSYKAYDRYSAGLGYPVWQTGATCFILDPKKKDITPVIGVDKATKMLNMLNGEQ